MPSDATPAPPRQGQARTRLSRRAVIEAARALFLQHGYTATTVAMISQAAEVPPATVYRLFSSKLGILKALLDVSIAGDNEPVPVLDRPGVAALLRSSDPRAILDGLAAVTTAINQRTSDIYELLRRAADADPEAAALLDAIGRQRGEGQGQIVRALHRKRLLRPGLPAAEAADIVHTILAPEVYRLLVHDRGWTPLRFQRWAASTLIQQLT